MRNFIPLKRCLLNCSKLYRNEVTLHKISPITSLLGLQRFSRLFTLGLPVLLNFGILTAPSNTKDASTKSWHVSSTCGLYVNGLYNCPHFGSVDPNWYTSTSSKSSPIAAYATATSKDEARDFMAVFPDVVRDLTDFGKIIEVPEATKWYAKVLQYNVPNGKKNRGLAVPVTYKLLMNKEQLPEKELYLTHIMGWCVELLQGYFLLIDDIMDESHTRRGRPCWYKTHDLGVKAIADGLLIQAGIFVLLKKHFKDQPYYVDATELFHDINFKTLMGEGMDVHSCSPNSAPNLDKFTMARYKTIVRYKSSYYTFHLPVALAMLMAGIKDPELHRQAKTVLLEMGHFYQVQDDYLDCFGDPEVTGKVGTDIEDGKCTWLAVLALQRFNPQQRAIMEECYGHKDPKKVQRVKELYEEVGIPSTYLTYEEESYNLITTQIQQISSKLPQELFFTFLRKIYRRSC